MTRATLNDKMSRVKRALVGIILIALVAKIVSLEAIGFGEGVREIADGLYDTLKEMAVVIATIAAVFVAAILQRRVNFIESLEEEWRNIVRVKSQLFAFCERDHPADAYKDRYIETFCAISEAIDSMRIVYRNVGETRGLVGLYPYVPLQDMRRALQTLDPDRLNEGRLDYTPAERKLVRDAVLQSFYALRESFVEELDLEEPQRPQLIAAFIRSKKRGAAGEALLAQEAQLRRQAVMSRPKPEVDALLQREWDREHNRPGPGAQG
jgi:hypothetical protein